MTVRVLAFVEGQTEEKFIKETVSPVLDKCNVFIKATTPGRKRFQGGVGKWTVIRKDLLRFLKEDKERYVTTMFDYYGMPTDWPGRNVTGGPTNAKKAEAVQKGMLTDISKKMGNSFDHRRFIPYVQMHEFEALLFSDPGILGKVIPGHDLTHDFQAIAEEFNNPEEIDDSPITAPSKRIIQLFSGRYQKAVHGNIAAVKIGLSLIRQKCPFFDQWLKKLESLQDENRLGE